MRRTMARTFKAAIPQKARSTFVCLVVVSLLGFWPLTAQYRSKPPFWRRRDSDTHERVLGPCAINLYGLPRSFQDLVLPSLIENVVLPNLKYQCDYFVHYHHRLSEPPGRDGKGGNVDPEAVLQIRSSILNVSDNEPKIVLTKTTEDEFTDMYRDLLEELHAAVDGDGKLLYVPTNHPSYDSNTVDNVIKMFHGQAAVWSSMEEASRSSNVHYSRVAMLRVDVVYVTPIDIYKLPDGSIDSLNQAAVVPGFAQHPVNDRLIYGPCDAVKLWAATRFDRLWKHIQMIRTDHPGDGIHSERFLAFTLFPAIRDTGVSILVDPELCFLRARSDMSIRLDDCGLHRATDAMAQAIQAMVNRRCRLNRTVPKLVHLECQGM
jgi:hypothetical protein